MAPMGLSVNGELVEHQVLSREAQALRQRFQQLSEEQRAQYGLEPGTMRKTAIEWARENVIEQVLLRQAAQEDPAPLDGKSVETNLAEVVERHGGAEKFAEAGLDAGQVRADIEARMKVDRLIAAVTAKTKQPRPKEMAEFYRRNKDRFKTEETIRAAHIVNHVEKGVTESEAKDAAEALYARLKAGASFEEVADQHSDCPGNGGDLGYFPRGKMVKEFEDTVFNMRVGETSKMVKEFEDTVFNMRVGETSEVFQTVFGFHIAKVLDRRPAGLRPFREVRNEIRAHIVERRRARKIEAYVDRLRESAVIEDQV
jgi:parvulin-like peptidyl-prolyl isomerase